MTLQELGQSLQEHREAVGLSLDDVSSRIKLSTRILRSIEEGSMVGMPHAVYTKRFIRSYGEVVGYDPEDLNAKLDIVFPPEYLEESRGDYGFLNRMEPPAFGGVKRTLGFLLVLLVLAGLAAGGWFVAKNYGNDIWGMIKKPFSAVSAPAANRTEGQKSAPAESSDGQLPGPAHSRLAGEPSEPRETEGQSDGEQSHPATQPASQTPLAAAASAEVPASLAAAGNAAPIASMQQVLITAREQCWINARADGASGREYTLRAGESFVLTFANSLDLSLGNAGGVSIIYNGKNLGRAGKSGQRAELHFPMPAQ